MTLHPCADRWTGRCNGASSRRRSAFPPATRCRRSRRRARSLHVMARARGGGEGRGRGAADQHERRGGRDRRRKSFLDLSRQNLHRADRARRFAGHHPRRGAGNLPDARSGNEQARHQAGDAAAIAEGIFVTQSALGIVPVAAFDGRPVAPSPLVDQIRRAYCEMLARP